MEDKQQLLESQLDQLANELEARIMDKLSRKRKLHPPQESVITASEKARKPRGRPRSKYQVLLHLKVLAEDKDWFMETAQSYEVLNGKLFSHLRALHEKHVRTEEALIQVSRELG